MNRPKEILQWLDEHQGEVTCWAALDDDIRCEKLGDHWFQCIPTPLRYCDLSREDDRNYGLTEELADKVIEFFCGSQE